MSLDLELGAELDVDGILDALTYVMNLSSKVQN